MRSEVKLPRRKIAFFGGQGCKSVFSQEVSIAALAYTKASPVASLLLSSCHAAFLGELLASATPDHPPVVEELQCFETPESLLSPEDIHQTNPIIQGVTLCIHQLLCYLRHLEPEDGSHSRDLSYSKDTSIQWSEVVGFCTGALPAAVVATSRTIDEYIEGSKQAVRLAFWVGRRVSSFCEELAGPQWRRSPWSMALFGVGQDCMDQIEDFNANNASSKLHVSAKLDPQSVTVSGPGRLLQHFESTRLNGTNPWEFIPIHALYHGGDDSKPIFEQVLRDVEHRNIQFPRLKSLHSPLRSTANGRMITASEVNDDLLHIVLHNVLVDCLDWNLTWDIICRRASESELANGTQGQVQAFGPYSPSLFASGGKRPGNAIELVDHSSAGVLGNALWPPESVAVVGMSVDFPGGGDKEAFWETLSTGVSTAEMIPESRYKISNNSAKGKSASSKDHQSECGYGNFLKSPWNFDPSFFGISPREAKSMDPQQKLLLQAALNALDDAGYVPDSTPSFQRKSFGCYVGVATADYVDNLRDDIDVYYSTGTLRAFLSGKISYAFKFSGPSITSDTACSASSVSIYQACRALSTGDCNAAIAGGVNVMTSPDMHKGLARAHFLSSTGQCKAFDSAADGYCRAEGCGLFVLKRLEDAIAENDRIYGVIRGVGVNQCGNACSITHPHSETQSTLFQNVLSKAGLKPRSVSLVEAHGTGTQAGDAAEMSSIQSVFGSNSSIRQPVHITSVKGNIGHAEAASGAASLAKILLQLREGEIPPQAGLTDFNPRLLGYNSPNMKISTAGVPWQSERDSPRVAMLNNFGAAGSNVSMLIQEYTSKAKGNAVNRTAYPFSISARTVDGTKRLCALYLEMLNSGNMSQSLVDVCYTATARRQSYDYSVSIVCKGLDDLHHQLQSPPIHSRPSKAKPSVFVFSGQGGIYIDMGRELLTTAPVFRDSVDHCERLLQDMGYPSILGMLQGGCMDDLHENTTVVSQTACFVVQWSLAKLWLSWNVKPRAVLGHSLGEFAAFVTAGVISLEDGLRFVARRAQLMVDHCSSQATGMLTCMLGHKDAASLISAHGDDFSSLTVACENSSQDSVVSGPLDQLRRFGEICAAAGHKSKLLDVPYGFHSPAMDPIIPALRELSSGIRCHSPELPLGSTVYGRLVSLEDMNADYFVRQTREAVRFSSLIHSIESEVDLQSAAFLEIGPTPLTLPLARRNLSGKEHEFLSSLKREEGCWTTLNASLLALDRFHCNVDWREVFSGTSARVVDAPQYPLEKAEHFLPYQERSSEHSAATENRADLTSTMLLQRKLSGSHDKPGAFESDLEYLSSYITGHLVGGVGLCPASVYYAMVIEGLQVRRNRSPQDGNVIITDVIFHSPLIYVRNSECAVHLELTSSEDSSGKHGIQNFTCSSTPQPNRSQHTQHVTGNFSYETTSSLNKSFVRKAATVSRQISLLESGSCRLNTFHTRVIYETIFSRVVLYSEKYRSIRHIKVTENGLEGFGVLQLPKQTIDFHGLLSPVFTDSIVHAAGFLANSRANASEAYICAKIETMTLLQDIDQYAPYTVYCSLLDGVESNVLANSYAIDSTGTMVAAIEGMHFKKVQLPAFKTHLGRQQELATAQSTTPQDESSSSSDSDSLDSPSVSSASSLPKPEDTPTTEDVNQTVSRALSRVTGTNSDSFSWDSRLEDVGVDSMLAIELCEELRNSLPSFSIESSALLQMETVQNLWDHVASTQTKPQHETSAPIPAPQDSSHGRSSQKGDDDLLKIRKTIGQVCGVPDVEIRSTSTLRELGIDSLLTIELQHSLRRELEQDLSGFDFADDMAVGDIAKLLSQRPSNTIHNSSRVCSTSQPDSQPREVKPTLLQSGATGSVPLVLFHDGSGVADMYSRLPDMGCVVFGVSNPGFGEASHWARSLEDMAAQYAAAIASFGDKEVVLGGWSFGGVLAYETAQQLSRLGKLVKGIILIDSPFPQDHRPLPDAIIEYVLRKLNPSTKRVLSSQFQAHAQLLASYNAKHDSSNARFTVLRSEGTFDTTQLCGVSYPWLEDDHKRSEVVSQWEKLINRRPLVLPIPGNHFEAFSGGNIDAVARRLREAYQYVTQET